MCADALACRHKTIADYLKSMGFHSAHSEFVKEAELVSLLSVGLDQLCPSTSSRPAVWSYISLYNNSLSQCLAQWSCLFLLLTMHCEFMKLG